MEHGKQRIEVGGKPYLLELALRADWMMPHTARLRRGRAKEMLVEATLAVGYDSLSRREGVSPTVVLGVRVIQRASAAA